MMGCEYCNGDRMLGESKPGFEGVDAVIKGSDLVVSGWYDSSVGICPLCIKTDITEKLEALGRMCKMACLATGERAQYDCYEVIYHCASCNAERAVYAFGEDGDVWAEKPAYCPSCGARVVEQ